VAGSHASQRKDYLLEEAHPWEVPSGTALVWHGLFAHAGDGCPESLDWHARLHMYLRILGFVGAETRTVENAEGARPSGYGCFRNHRAFFLFYCTGVCRLCVVTTWQAALFRVRVYGTAAATRPTNELQERRRRCHTLCDNLVMNHAELVFFLSFRAPIRASEDNYDDDDYGIF